ncbi:predicted protein [Nematostella vectensis]|uniref:Saccharopine dehydrogenase [NAD(+), L-lysine-forming] n=1 Tax=Nematostella vectensis TaxID=45351 RepID=A7S2W5_NEMVE|nr:predicted protein [Nematostella vectensis]|eukprot:XP_001634023.1 predicted protein [Nematostella vectensis]
MAAHLWLRAECKPLERRAHLTPEKCKELVDAGFKVTVESSDQRIFKNEEYASIAGVEVLAPGITWEKAAPKDAIILGLKNLPYDDTSPISQHHVFFAHAYKDQPGAKEVIGRFTRGGGAILDIEYMLNEEGKREVAEFSPIAGQVGMALGIAGWCHQQLGERMPSVSPYDSEALLVQHVQSLLKRLAKKKGVAEVYPTIIVLGALGRCGKGSLDMAKKIGIPKSHIAEWDLEETKAGGPFKEILNYDIFVNDIFLLSKIPPFLTKDMLDTDDRKLTMVVDVSCDIGNPNNPVPFIENATTPTKPVDVLPLSKCSKPLELMAIDFLPSMLPREASLRFANKMTPCLMKIAKMDEAICWSSAKKAFQDKAKEFGLI